MSESANGYVASDGRVLLVLTKPDAAKGADGFYSLSYWPSVSAGSSIIIRTDSKISLLPADVAAAVVAKGWFQPAGRVDADLWNNAVGEAAAPEAPPAPSQAAAEAEAAPAASAEDEPEPATSKRKKP